MKNSCRLGTVFLLIWSIAVAAQTRTPQFRQVNKFIVGGEGGWDYIRYDAAAHRLFIAHGNRILVVDAATGQQIGALASHGAHGIALVSELNRGFFTNGRVGTVTAFDSKTLKPLGDIKAGENPDAIIYDEFSRRVVVMNGRSKELMAIDPQQMKVVATVPLGGKLEYAATDKDRVYVNVESSSEIAVVDSKSWTPVQRWKLNGCEDPTGLAIDRKSGHLFAACGNAKMVVLDTKNGALVETLPTGKGSAGAAFDPALNVAFASNGDGTLTVIEQTADGRYKVAENVATQRGARTLALDSASHTIYLPTQDERGFCVLVVAPTEKPQR
jgi:DNA-binding beta-propeller fold protein YncE